MSHNYVTVAKGPGPGMIGMLFFAARMDWTEDAGGYYETTRLETSHDTAEAAEPEATAWAVALGYELRIHTTPVLLMGLIETGQLPS